MSPSRNAVKSIRAWSPGSRPNDLDGGIALMIFAHAMSRFVRSGRGPAGGWWGRRGRLPPVGARLVPAGARLVPAWGPARAGRGRGGGGGGGGGDRVAQRPITASDSRPALAKPPKER